MIPLSPAAIRLHRARALAAAFLLVAGAACLAQVGGSRPVAGAGPVYSADDLQHADAVYRTRRYPEAEDALRCAGFTDLAPTRPGLTRVPGRDYEIVPHPAVRHAAEVDLPPNVSGAGLCAYLRQPPVREWYRQHFGI
jgi:hypothetical protein